MSIPNEKTKPFDNKTNLSDWLAAMPNQQRDEFMQLVYLNLAKHRAQKCKLHRKSNAHS